MSRILVTGATGFVGRALVADFAAAGHEVRAAVRRTSVQFAPAVEVAVHGNLSEGIDWRPLVLGMDAVIHLAGIAHAGAGIDEARYDRVNHQATAELANAARAAGVGRLVFVSSIRAQSGPAADHVLSEADEPRPDDPYGRSKLAAELAVSRSGAPFTIMRPVLIYGRGVKGNLHTLIRLAALPIPLPFRAFRNRRSVLSVHNLVAAIAQVLRNESSRGETYVVADPQPISFAGLVTALRAGMGKSHGLIAVPPGLVGAGLAAVGRSQIWNQLNGELIVDPAKLIATGWRPDADTEGAVAAMTRELRASS